MNQIRTIIVYCKSQSTDDIRFLLKLFLQNIDDFTPKWYKVSLILLSIADDTLKLLQKWYNK